MGFKIENIVKNIEDYSLSEFPLSLSLLAILLTSAARMFDIRINHYGNH